MTTTAPAPPTAAPVMERIRLTGPPGFVVGAQPHAAFRSETGLSERLVETAASAGT